jgi:hypothetical protein
VVPTFYFHVVDESGTVRKDERGAELADKPAAREQAEQIGRQFLDKEVSTDGLPFDDPAKLAIEVRDGSGEVVCTVPLSELTEPPGDRLGQAVD